MAKQTNHIGEPLKMITAVEFIQKNLNAFNWEQVFKYAKQMEESQIVDAYNFGGYLDYTAEEFYNKTYGK